MSQQNSSSVLLYSDHSDTSLELVTLAKRLGAASISVAVLGPGDLQSEVSKLQVDGVNAIYKVSSDSLSGLLAEPVVEALESIFDQAKPSVVMIGATRRGKEIAPRLAARLKLGCITDVSKTELTEKGAKADRIVWGGNAIATVSSKGGVVLTIPLKSNERASGTSRPRVIEVGVVPKPSKVRIVGRKEKPQGQVSIKDAEVIVSAGRGFKKKEDLSLLDGLAGTLHAVIGASRPLTSDLAWMSEERQVGLSGTTVKPKLYVAVGISGQIQHLTGMRDSKAVVAINTDKNAPIFQECDYGIVGDLYTVVPELDKALKTQLGR